jgi:hypothetical protein
MFLGLNGQLVRNNFPAALQAHELPAGVRPHDTASLLLPSVSQQQQRPTMPFFFSL